MLVLGEESDEGVFVCVCCVRVVCTSVFEQSRARQLQLCAWLFVGEETAWCVASQRNDCCVELFDSGSRQVIISTSYSRTWRESRCSHSFGRALRLGLKQKNKRNGSSSAARVYVRGSIISSISLVGFERQKEKRALGNGIYIHT